MKFCNSVKLLIIELCCIFCSLFIGCEYDGIPMYFFGENNIFNNSIIRVDLDEIEEKFVFDYKAKDSSENFEFYFRFGYGNNIYLKNSAEFDYITDDGQQINFNENGKYVFNEDKKIIISYKNASEEIKQAISDRSFSVTIGSGSFILYGEDIKD